MEDVLEVYTRPHDPDFPVVCLDETSKQLIAENPSADSVEARTPARHDYEYERNGTANLFMMFAPLEGFRHVKVTDRHTALDYAQVLKELSDTHFPDAKKILPGAGQSQHSTNRRHSTKPFPPPKHAGWSKGSSGTIRPNMAAGWIWLNPELGVLSSQCLGRRIPDKQTLIVEVAAWRKTGNKRHNQGRLAIYYRRRPHQTEAALPSFLNDSRH